MKHTRVQTFSVSDPYKEAVRPCMLHTLQIETPGTKQNLLFLYVLELCAKLNFFLHVYRFIELDLQLSGHCPDPPLKAHFCHHLIKEHGNEAAVNNARVSLHILCEPAPRVDFVTGILIYKSELEPVYIFFPAYITLLIVLGIIKFQQQFLQ